MKTTYIVNLFGGPGSGKSTTAAGLFHNMKVNGESVELVREYCKEWAWRGQPIGKWDGLYFLAKQLKAESVLYGKVDTIITDAPKFLMAIYEVLYHPESQLLLNAVTELHRQQELDGIFNVNCLVVRNKPYVLAGRNETEEQARKVDLLCEQMVPSLSLTHSVSEVYSALRDERSHY